MTHDSLGIPLAWLQKGERSLGLPSEDRIAFKERGGGRQEKKEWVSPTYSLLLLLSKAGPNIQSPRLLSATKDLHSHFSSPSTRDHSAGLRIFLPALSQSWMAASQKQNSSWHPKKTRGYKSLH